MNTGFEEAVKQQAQGRCEYCRFPEAFTRMPFQMDYVVPARHGGSSAAENLAYACFSCSTRKGPNLAAIDPVTGALTRLFHPRRDVWEKHFRWKGPMLVGVTAAGRSTIELLGMNRADERAVREALREEGVM